MLEDALATYGYLGVFLVSLAVNLLPFTSPSNMILAGAATFLLPTANPLLVGLSVAVAASAAKTAHYYVASYVGARAGRKAEKLESYGRRLGRWGALAVFIAAATPIPDDPVVIPLGMAKYSPVRFFVAYFTGKTLVSVAGAYVGRQSALTLQSIFPSNEYIILSAIASILIASALLKADLPALSSRVRRMVKGNLNQEPHADYDKSEKR